MKKSFGHKDTGFRIPENYFREFHGRLSLKLREEAFLEGKTASGFGVPKGYFENFKVAIPAGTKVVPLFRRGETWAYAASIAAVFILVFNLFKSTPDGSLSFSKIDGQSMETYIESRQIDFFEMEMQTFLLEEAQFGDARFDEISDEAILDYLATHENELSYLNR